MMNLFEVPSETTSETTWWLFWTVVLSWYLWFEFYKIRLSVYVVEISLFKKITVLNMLIFGWKKRHKSPTFWWNDSTAPPIKCLIIINMIGSYWCKFFFNTDVYYYVCHKTYLDFIHFSGQPIKKSYKNQINILYF